MLANLKTHGDLHLPRKIFHVLSILFILACMIFFPPKICWTIYFCVGMPMVLIDFGRKYNPALNRLFLKLIGPFLRKHEARQASGAAWSIIGVGICYFIFPIKIAQLATLFLAVGDPSASFFGVLFGKRNLWRGKSLAGFAGCFLVCTIAAQIFLHYTTSSTHLPLALLFGAVGCIAEAIPVWKLDDNLSQPLISSTLIFLLYQTIGAPV